MPSKIRLQRISDRIRQELSEMLVKEVQDPRLSGISVTDVKVDRELAFAEIFVSAVEGQERSKEVLAGLRSAAGYLRHELASRVDLRAFPILRFHWDPTPERADHIERLLASLHQDEASQASTAADSGADEALEDEALEDEALEDEALEDEALEDEALEDEALEDEADAGKADDE